MKEMKEFLTVNFGTANVADVDPQELKEKLAPKSILPRIQYRKQFGNALAGRKDIVVVKGMKH
jgi:hypothetical protein